MNRVTLVGNLTVDPEFKELAGDKMVCKLRLALNGYKKDETIYVDVDAWGKLASVCNEYLSKGSKVAIDGRLALNQWETSEGEKRQKLYVVADQIDFMSSRGETSTKKSSSSGKNEEDDDEVPF